MIGNPKISLINYDFIVIENYQKILLISDVKVIVDKYEIIGQELKVKCMDDYTIEMSGKIERIGINV